MNTVFVLAASISIVPSIIGLYKFKTLNRVTKLILLYALLSLLMSIISYLAKIYSINNLPLFHLFTVIEFVLFVEFYKSMSKQKMQTLLFSLQIFFCGFAVINALFLESIFEHNTYPGAIGGIILILLSLKLFYDVFEKEEKEFQTAPLIYFNIGIFLYFSVTLLILLLGNYLLKASDTFYYRIWLIRWIADILFYILLAIGLWIHKRK